MRIKNKKLLHLLLAIPLTPSYAITNHNLVAALELAALLPEKETKFDEFWNQIENEAENIAKDFESEYDKLVQDFELTKPKTVPAPQQVPNNPPMPPKGKLPPPPPLPPKNFRPKEEPKQNIAPAPKQAPEPKQNNQTNMNNVFEQIKEGKAKRTINPDIQRYNDLKNLGALNASQKEEFDALKAKLHPEQSKASAPKGKSNFTDNLAKALAKRRQGIVGSMGESDDDNEDNAHAVKPQGKYPPKPKKSDDNW